MGAYVFFSEHAFAVMCMCVYTRTGQVSDEHCSALVLELVVRIHRETQVT